MTGRRLEPTRFEKLDEGVCLLRTDDDVDLFDFDTRGNPWIRMRWFVKMLLRGVRFWMGVKTDVDTVWLRVVEVVAVAFGPDDIEPSGRAGAEAPADRTVQLGPYGSVGVSRRETSFTTSKSSSNA